MSSRKLTITINPAGWTGALSPRAQELGTLDGFGHDLRRNSGAAEMAMRRAAAKKRITGADIKKIFEAADMEVMGTQFSRDVFHPDFETLYAEWGHKFLKSATSALEIELKKSLAPAPNLDDPKLEVTTPAEANGLLYAAVEDGCVSQKDVKQIIKAGKAGGVNVTPQLKSLYGSKELDLPKRVVDVLRANIEDPGWLARMALVQEVRKFKKIGAPEIRKLHELAVETFDGVEGPDLVANISAALREHAVADDLVSLETMTKSGRAEISEAFRYDRLGAAIRSRQGAFDVNAAKDFFIAADEEHGGEGSGSLDALALGFLQDYRRATGHWFFDDPRITPDALDWLDRKLFGEGTAEARAEIRELDTLSLFEMLVEQYWKLSDTFHDPDTRVEIRIETEANNDLVIHGLPEVEGSVALRARPKVAVFLGEQKMPREQAIEALENPQLTRAVRHIVDRMISRRQYRHPKEISSNE